MAASSSSSSTSLSNLVRSGTKEEKALVQLLAALTPPIKTADELLSSKSRAVSRLLRMTSPKALDDLKIFISAELCAMFSYSSSSSTSDRSRGWQTFASLSASSSSSNLNKLSSGFVNLDALLPGNGFTAGHIYEILGPAASGKSQICMSILAAAAVVVEDRKLLYIDTSGCVTYGRICDMIMCNFKRLYDKSPSSLEVSAILSRIHVARVTDPWKCLNIISAFKCGDEVNGSTSSSISSNNSDVIIVDSIHDLFSPYITEEMNSRCGSSSKFKSSSSELKLPSVSVEPILAQTILLLRSLVSTTVFISNLTYQDLDERVISDNSVVWTDGIDGSLLLWRHAATTSYAMIRFMHVGGHEVCYSDANYNTEATQGEEKMESDATLGSARECLIDFKL